MHILIICQYFYPESFRINDIASEWIKHGHKVSVVTGIPNYPEGRFFKGYGIFKKRKEILNGISIYRLPIIPRGQSKIGIILNYLSFMMSGLVWANTTRMKSDVVFSFETSPMTQVLVGTRYAKRTHTRHILYIQDLWPENVEEVGGIHSPVIIHPLDCMVKYIYRNADLILATSPSFVEMIRKRMEDDDRIKGKTVFDKIAYWPQYAEKTYKPIEKSSRRDNIFRIVFTGNIGYAQGLEILPECAAILKEKGLDDRFRFVIVGDGRAKDSFLRSIISYNVSDMFEMRGRKKTEEIPVITSECNIAFLSFADNDLFSATIPAKLQSYLACAIPIVAAASGETKRIIEEAKCGICTRPGDAEALVESIIKMSEKSNAEIDEMSLNALAYSKTHFDQNILMEEMESFLTAVE